MSVDTSKKIEPAAAEKLMGDAVNWTEYDGLRVTSHSSGAVYLVIWGQLHWIPNLATFNSVFKDWSGIVNSDYIVDNMPKGPMLTPDSFIADSQASPAVYLVSLGKKQWVPDPATFTKFNFHAPVTLPHVALDFIPTGPNIG